MITQWIRKHGYRRPVSRLDSEKQVTNRCYQPVAVNSRTSAANIHRAWGSLAQNTNSNVYMPKRGKNSTERVYKYLHVQGSAKHIDRKFEGNRNNNSKQVTQMRRIDTKVGISGKKRYAVIIQLRHTGGHGLNYSRTRS